MNKNTQASSTPKKISKPRTVNNTRIHAENVAAAGGGKYRCLFRRDGTNGYCVTCDDLPEMIVSAPTLSEARASARAEIAELLAEEAHVQARIAAVQPDWW